MVINNDSDYTPAPVTVQNVNPGLRHPSKERMKAQRQIIINRERLGLPTSNVNKNVNQSSPDSDPLSGATNGYADVSASNPEFPTKSVPSIPPTPVSSSSPCNNRSTSAQALAGAISSSLHKRKPKPCGKHHRPMSQLSSNSDSAPKIKRTKTQSVAPQPRSEFVTKQFGIIKRKKARKIM